MSTFSDGTRASDVVGAAWIKSSYSGPPGNCVEVAFLRDGGVAMRNSRHPDGPALVFTAPSGTRSSAARCDGEFGTPG